MDGVLFDTIPFAEEHFINGRPGVTSEMYRNIHKGNYHEEAKKYDHLKIERSEEEETQNRLVYMEKKSKTKMFKGVRELLENLKKDGYLLVINTNAFDRNCFPLIDNSGIRQLFDFIATAEVSKDKIEKFKIIQDKYEVDKKDILFVTDAVGDIKDSQVADISTIAVTWGVHDRKFFESEHYSNLVSIVDTVQELENYIKRNFN